MNVRVELLRRIDESPRVGRLPGQAGEIVDQRGAEPLAEFPPGQLKKLVDPGDSHVRQTFEIPWRKVAVNKRHASKSGPNRLFDDDSHAGASQHQGGQGCRRDRQTLLVTATPAIRGEFAGKRLRAAEQAQAATHL